MQHFSLDTNILHKTQTHLQQMTEEGSIQHCIKVKKCKLVVNWSKMKQFFFNFSFHKNTFFFFFYIFFPPTLQEINSENQVGILLNSEFWYSFFTDKYRSHAEVFPHWSFLSLINCRKMEENYNANITVINHRLCFNWKHIYRWTNKISKLWLNARYLKLFHSIISGFYSMICPKFIRYSQLILL